MLGVVLIGHEPCIKSPLPSWIAAVTRTEDVLMILAALYPFSCTVCACGLHSHSTNLLIVDDNYTNTLHF